MIIIAIGWVLASGPAPTEEPPPPAGAPADEPDPAPPEAGPSAAAPSAPAPPEGVDELVARVAELERRLAAMEAKPAPAAAPLPQPPTVFAHLVAPPAPFALSFDGYGDLQLAFHDFGPNQNRAGGAQDDARLVFDTTRFVLELEGVLPLEVELEAEIEFEHGGTGAAMELEYEEFGEFEQEVEKGGEVLLEELHLTKRFAEHYALTLGRFYVAMGLLSRYYRPTDYLATTRAESETTLSPAVWDEMGVQLQAYWPWVRLTAQVVNGLDSTGFSSQRFVAAGHQRRFELVQATDLAFVGRVDVLPIEESEVGVGAYWGGTSRNRPKADLVRDCTDGDADAVAPCGYVDAPLLLVDAHGQVRYGPLRGSALVLWGHLWNADVVSARNERLSNSLNVLRSPVADEGLAVWAELGLDVAPWLALAREHHLEPFARVDFYDTMFGTRAGLFDNPRFQRTVVTAGLSYVLAEALVVKLDGSHRRFGTDQLRPENTVRLAAGFVF